MSLTYTADFVNTFVFTSQFTFADCIIPVDMNNPDLVGPKFKAILALANEYFQSVTIVLCDTLHRHCLELETDIEPEQARQFAQALGKKWQQAHLPLLEKLTIPYTLQTWRQWLSSKFYLQQRNRMKALYDNNPVIHAAFDKTVKQRFPNNHLKNPDKALEYIIEQCSILPLWANENVKFILHPDPSPPSIRAVCDALIKPKYPNLLRWTQLSLKPNPPSIRRKSQSSKCASHYC